jgi:2-oxoglutarate dehydrogenase E1 component
LYPFPEDEIRALVEGYPNLREVVWVQEEPKNAGAWSFAEPRLRELLGEELPLRYVGKPGRPAPSQGSAGFHKREHEQLILSAFREDGLGEVEGAVRGTQGRAPGRSD